jgi:hypothetical protein
MPGQGQAYPDDQATVFGVAGADAAAVPLDSGSRD